jgi:hypothetical protein
LPGHLRHELAIEGLHVDPSELKDRRADQGHVVDFFVRGDRGEDLCEVWFEGGDEGVGGEEIRRSDFSSRVLGCREHQSNFVNMRLLSGDISTVDLPVDVLVLIGPVGFVPIFSPGQGLWRETVLSGDGGNLA